MRLEYALLFAGVALLAYGSPAQGAEDPLDAQLSSILTASPQQRQDFYRQLLDATLYVVADPQTSGSTLVFLPHEAPGVKTVYVYTSEQQLFLDPHRSHGKAVGLPGRELLSLIRRAGCEAGLNPYSGHGGRLTLSKLDELLTPKS